MKTINGGITAPAGFLASGVCAEIKKADKKDVAIIFSEVPCTAAGVFTTNAVRAACIDVNKKHLQNGRAQVIVANSGNANACTGEQGVADTVEMAKLTAELLSLEPQDILVASTGVIGVFMPMYRITSGIKAAAPLLSLQGSDDAAQAIMTTDLAQKTIAVEIELNGKAIKIGAIAKGSGMIHPNMATMLGFITTDAAISADCLHKLISESSKISYNMVSVDRDTSTNDMAIILANGLAGNSIIDDPHSGDFKLFKEALDFVNTTLAKKIARDGEGASHLIEVKVINAADENTARLIARSITGSNLTKAAVFGEDANWGRILAAAGYSSAQFDPDKVDIYLGQEKMAEGGMGLIFDEEKARLELQKEEVLITVDLNSGQASATAWGCDLSYEYVRINAAYRT
ncbi:MAG: bifunctional glutamate N-acetyltransferase/amino-acid acetyltransferase ArgJ [Syntrophomonadaceae bacterium]|nr:bifunctional glutamate N-acetyltransferase/amino-acid acetyltransferase ArgJ [Syntrophomonadaceae bacterium]